jgi:4-amino-4-deoxy-L-arabinose transferase-like glycosyltransferase
MTRRPWLCLTAVFLTLAAVTAVWVSIDRRPPEWDHANHLERALRCHRSLAEGRLWAAISGDSAFYPPLVPCAAGVLYFAFPIVPLTAQAVMLAFLALGMAAVFGVGRILWDDRAGLLAAFLFGTAPFVVFSLLNFQLDLPLASIVALTLWILLRTQGFRRPAWTAALGLVVGLGLLTKPTYLVYVAAPIVHQAFAGSRGGEGRRRLALLGLAAGIAAVIALPWYGQRIVGMPFQVVDRSFKQAAEADQAALFSWTWLLFYPRVFQPQFGLLAGLACVWGLWALWRDRRARAYLWLATLPGLFVFSIIQNRNLRYTLPLLPAAALVAAAGIRSFRMPWRRVAVVALVAAAALQVSMTTFAIPPPPTLDVFLTPIVLPLPPMRTDWQQQRILDELMRVSGGKPARVAVVPNYNFLAVSNLRYEALVRQLPLEVTRAWAGPPLGVDLMVLKTGSQGPSFSAAKPEGIMRAFAGGDPDLATAFPVVAEYPLPDGSQAIIRARRIPPLVGVDPAEVARRLQQAQEAAMADFIRDAVGLRVSLEYRPDAILRGEVDRVRVEVEAATIGELKRRDRAPLRVRDVRIEVDRLLINPQRLMRTGAIEVLDAGALRIDRAVITQADLDALLAGQPIGAWLTVRFTEGWADVKAKGLPGGARVGMGPGTPTAPFVLKVADLNIAGVPITSFLVDWVVRHFDPTVRLRRLPVPVSVAPIRIKSGRLEIGA